MLAMVLREIGGPLLPEERPDPIPGPGEVRIRVEACAVCRTDLHVIDGELPQAVYPIVPGHEVVGNRRGRRRVRDRSGTGSARRDALARARLRPLRLLSDRAGEPVRCPGFTGCTRDGGFATHLLAERPSPSRST